MTTIIPGGDLFLEPAEQLSARRALLRLLTRYPNTVVTREQVEEEAGRKLSRGAVSRAATVLRRDMAIRTGDGGGYVLLSPTLPWWWKKVCVSCTHHTALGHCRELDRETGGGLWCWGWTGRA